MYDEDGEIIGYVTLAWAQIEVTVDQKRSLGLHRIPYPAIPVLLLSRLAVRLTFQSRGVGREIIAWVRALAGNLPVACRFIALHVAQDSARAIMFSQRHGFFMLDRADDRGLSLMVFDLTP